MKGKINQGSSGIQEDEARVLFDYFSQAARRVVSEEMDFERKIDEQQGYLAKETDRRAKEFRKNLAITIACAVIGIGLAFIPFLLRHLEGCWGCWVG